MTAFAQVYTSISYEGMRNLFVRLEHLYSCSQLSFLCVWGAALSLLTTVSHFGHYRSYTPMYFLSFPFFSNVFYMNASIICIMLISTLTEGLSLSYEKTWAYTSILAFIPALIDTWNDYRVLWSEWELFLSLDHAIMFVFYVVWNMMPLSMSISQSLVYPIVNFGITVTELSETQLPGKSHACLLRAILEKNLLSGPSIWICGLNMDSQSSGNMAEHLANNRGSRSDKRQRKK